MVKLPRIPQAWKDQSAGTPQEILRARPDLNALSEGVLGGWQPPGWSPAGSGLAFLFHPQTIAQIDFGDKRVAQVAPAAPVNAAPAPPAGMDWGFDAAADRPGHVLRLSNADILSLKKTLQTEWVQSAGTDQAKGIVDTIVNRLASGHWGGTIVDVVNARSQFSDINGPVAWRNGRNSVNDLPDSSISRAVYDFVDAYLTDRANGTPSSVGTNLNYANPNYSSPRNLTWIRALDGPTFGVGRNIHIHGTVPNLQRHRPQPYSIAVP